MSIYAVPKDLRNLRACLVCSLVKTVDQFEEDGCDNCDRYLGMKGDVDKVYEATSANFDGLIAACNPVDSWVCKWQNIDRKCKGVYAMSVTGSLPKHIVAELKSCGVKYRANQRDKSVK